MSDDLLSRIDEIILYGRMMEQLGTFFEREANLPKEELQRRAGINMEGRGTLDVDGAISALVNSLNRNREAADALRKIIKDVNNT